MALRPEALSEDGFIIDQRKTDNIPFGRITSDRNGCGWIACYNLLKALGRDPDPEALAAELEKTLLAGGFLGLHLFALVRELRKQKVPLHFALDSFHARELSERDPAGIILYYAGKRNHFAAFRREPDGKLRFFGAVPGRTRDRGTLGDFYRDRVKFPLALTITADLSAQQGHFD